MDKLSQEMLRKLVHLSSVWMVFAIYFLPKHVVVLIFGSLSLLTFVVEWLRRNNNFAKKIFIMLFGRMLRESEIDKEVTGAVYFVFAALVVCVVFSKEIAVIALSVMIIADTAAALIGKKFGKTVLIGNKTLEGAQAFFISAVITIICLEQLLHIDFYYSTVFIAAGCGTFAELFSKRIKIDDNLLVPLVVGVVLCIF